MKRPNLFGSPQYKYSKYQVAPVRRGVDERRAPLRLNLVGKVVIAGVFVLGLVLGGGRCAAAGSIAIGSPAKGATVRGVAAIVTSQTPDVGWVAVFVDKTLVGWSWNIGAPISVAIWNSATVPDGSHTIGAAGYGVTGAMVAAASVVVTVQNGATALPTPAPSAGATPTAALASPIPTPLPTPPPPGVISYPLADAAAAAQVVLDPGFEPRPENDRANHSVPTAAQLAVVRTLSLLDGHGNSLLAQVTGNYTGTTDEILQWAAHKWGFDPDITRANAVTESRWRQYDIGDVSNGVSLGILQIKSSDFMGTCSPVSLSGGDTSLVTDPSCLSYNYTAFAADYKLAYQRACMDGSINYLSSQAPTSGYPTYANATGDARLWGCIGDWFSGNWYDSGAISYIQDVQDNLATRPWLAPGF